MKLLTLNTHSRPEDCAASVSTLAAWITTHRVDVIALQEVNQSLEAPAADETALHGTGFVATNISEVALKQDNYAYALARALQERGCAYRWCYLPVKRGYDRYDEGLSLFWRGEAAEILVVELSQTRDYHNWRRRRAVGIQLGAYRFYSVHTSRYDDAVEPFLSQWQRLRAHLQGTEQVFLMGDFNCPADHSNEGYDRMIADGWRDAFSVAHLNCGYRTVNGSIDGWRDVAHSCPQRIDFIMTNDTRLSVSHCETVFDGQRGQIISDHCGVFCCIGEEDGQDGGRDA